MSGTKTAAIAVAATGLAAVLLYYATTVDPPIIIGDGSVFISHDGITKNSATDIETSKLLHKVLSITVIDRSGSAASPLDVKNRKWTLTNATNQVVFDSRSKTLGDGVGGTCKSGWQGTGTYYVCHDDKLTPATLTFTDGKNCPNTTTPACTLSCTSGYCMLVLEYK